MSKVIEHNVGTGEVTQRDMTKAELDQLQAAQKELEALREAEAIKAAEKTALLHKLGITADEAALLLS
jgi:hypothetical protein